MRAFRWGLTFFLWSGSIRTVWTSYAFAVPFPAWLHPSHAMTSSSVCPNVLDKGKGETYPRPASSSGTQRQHSEWRELRTLLAETTSNHNNSSNSTSATRGIDHEVVPDQAEQRGEWEHLFSSQLRHEYESYLSTNRAPRTVKNHLKALRHLFRRAATFIINPSSKRPPKAITTRNQLQSFLHKHQEDLFAVIDTMPRSTGKTVITALRQFIKYADEEELWFRLISPSMQTDFERYLRISGVSDFTIDQYLSRLASVFRQLPLDQEEVNSFPQALSSRANLHTFLRRHIPDIGDIKEALPSKHVQTQTHNALKHLFEFTREGEFDYLLERWAEAKGQVVVKQTGKMKEKGKQKDDTVDTLGTQLILEEGEDGGPGTSDAMDSMLEAVSELQEEVNQKRGQATERAVGRKRYKKFRRPWVRPQSQPSPDEGHTED